MISLFSCRPLRSRTNGDGADRDYQRVDFTIHTPTYSVKYLGSQKLCSPGYAEICNTVKTIYVAEKPKQKKIDHYSLKLTKEELSLRDRDSTEDEEKLFLLRRIRFTGVCKAHQRVFFFTYQFGSKSESVECNVVLCKSNNEAKSLAKVISKAFADARSDLHHQEVASRKLHAEGLSETSMSHLHEDVISNVEANRQYYNMGAFKNSRSNSAASAISDFRSKSRTSERHKQSNQSCHLGASIEWERTESSLDTRTTDAEKTSTSGETFGCICEESLLKVDRPEQTALDSKDDTEGTNGEIVHENEPLSDLDLQLISQSSSTLAEEIDVDDATERDCSGGSDWSVVPVLQETSI